MSSSTEAVSTVRSKRILVAEDTRDIRYLISVVLREAGYEVTLAANGQEGLDAFVEALEAGNPFDLVLSDIRMPLMSGGEMVRKIRERCADVPVLIISGSSVGRSDRDRILQDTKAAGFIAKPFSLAQLEQVVAQTLIGNLVER